jgi:hypothetical protein
VSGDRRLRVNPIHLDQQARQPTQVIQMIQTNVETVKSKAEKNAMAMTSMENAVKVLVF